LGQHQLRHAPHLGARGHPSLHSIPGIGSTPSPSCSRVWSPGTCLISYPRRGNCYPELGTHTHWIDDTINLTVCSPPPDHLHLTAFFLICTSPLRLRESAGIFIRRITVGALVEWNPSPAYTSLIKRIYPGTSNIGVQITLASNRMTQFFMPTRLQLFELK